MAFDDGKELQCSDCLEFRLGLNNAVFTSLVKQLSPGFHYDPCPHRRVVGRTDVNRGAHKCVVRSAWCVGGTRHAARTQDHLFSGFANKPKNAGCSGTA